MHFETMTSIKLSWLLDRGTAKINDIALKFSMRLDDNYI